MLNRSSILLFCHSVINILHGCPLVLIAMAMDIPRIFLRTWKWMTSEALVEKIHEIPNENFNSKGFKTTLNQHMGVS